MQSGQTNEGFACVDLEDSWEGDTHTTIPLGVKSFSFPLKSDRRPCLLPSRFLYCFQAPKTGRPKAVMVQQ